MSQLKTVFHLPLLVMMSLVASGCTTLKSSDDPTLQSSSDPFYGLNRRVHTFNDAADKAILRPVAKTYDAVLPDVAQNSVSRFFSNLGEPLNIVNNLLQGKVDGALNSTYRFAVNSTIGVLGLFDVAKAYDVEKKPEDFGQTLAAWGVKPGPYVMVPFLGPTTLRDGFGRIIDTATYYPINEISDNGSTQVGLAVLDFVDDRADLLGTDEILDRQLDPYLFLKDAYDQSRLNAVYDGSPPEQLDNDIDF